MSTLKDARRDYARRISDPDNIHAAAFRAHQDEYILPVYKTTTMDEITHVMPTDAKRVVLCVIDGSWMGYSFFGWQGSAEADDAPDIPIDGMDDPDVPATKVDGDFTVADLMRNVEGKKGTMSVEALLDRAVKTQAQAKMKRASRRKKRS